ERHRKLIVALEYLFGRDDYTGAPVDATRRPAATAMNCDDTGGHTLDKYGDMIGEGDKGTNGLGHDKDLCDDALAAYGMPAQPLSTGRMGGSKPCDVAARPSQAVDEAGADRVGYIHEPDRDHARRLQQCRPARSAGFSPRMPAKCSGGCHAAM